MKPKLSIIVPVYNVENYLSQCIDSILNQTLTDFELILIDDGSSDNSPRICDKYAKKDDRILVIHQENTGVSAARNAGMDVARGEYIGFVDSDDWIESDMYEVMLNIAEKKSLDIVICGIKEVRGNVINVRENSNYEDIILFPSNDDLLSDVFARPSKNLGVIWNKIFRKDIVKNIRFPSNITVCEDLVFLVHLYVRNLKSAVLSQKFYFHRFRLDSVTGGRTPKLEKRAFEKYIFRDVQKHKPYYCGVAICYFLDSLVWLIQTLKDNVWMGVAKKIIIVFRSKMTILHYIFYARVKGYIAKTEFNRFLMEGVLKI